MQTLTPTRGAQMQAVVLDLLKKRQRPVSAYDILHALRGPGAKLAPTTIYRALNALCARGEVHRIESLNAYAARRGTDPRAPVILAICDSCGALAETPAPDLLGALTAHARRAGFEPVRHVVELHGHCTACSPETRP